MFEKKKYNAVVRYPDGRREVITVQSSSEWDVRYALPFSVKEQKGEFLYAVEEKYSGLIEKLNQVREKRVETRKLVHSIFVDRITPENGEVYADIRSGTVCEVYRHPEDPKKVILDDKYVADKDHFYRLSHPVDKISIL